MADNFTYNNASGTSETGAADDVGGVKYPRVKLVWGADGAVNDASAAAPIPVVQTGDPALPSDAATQTTLAAVLAKLTADPATQTTLAAILAKITADPATQTTLAALLAAVSALDAAIPGVGQGAMAASLPVVVASDQSTIPVSVSGVATAANQATANTSLSALEGFVNGLEASSAAIQTAAESLDAAIPVPGQAAMAASVPVVIASNQTAVPVADGGGSLTVDGSVSLAAAIPAGTNNIGDVDVLSLPALPAGTNNIGDIDVLTLPTDTYSAKTQVETTSGDKTVVDVSGTVNVRLYYICLSAPSGNSASVTCTVKFASTSLYTIALAPGAMWARNIGAGRRYLQGANAEDLVVNLSASQTVNISVEYETGEF